MRIPCSVCDAGHARYEIRNTLERRAVLNQIPRHHAAPCLRENPRVALVGIEGVAHMECLGVGRHSAGGLDASAPLAPADGDRPVAALECREWIALGDGVG